MRNRRVLFKQWIALFCQWNDSWLTHDRYPRVREKSAYVQSLSLVRLLGCSGMAVMSQSRVISTLHVQVQSHCFNNSDNIFRPVFWSLFGRVELSFAIHYCIVATLLLLFYLDILTMLCVNKRFGDNKCKSEMKRTNDDDIYNHSKSKM